MKTFEETKELMERIEKSDHQFYFHDCSKDGHKELWLTLGTKHGNTSAEIHFPPRDEEESECTQMGYEQLEEWSKSLKS